MVKILHMRPEDEQAINEQVWARVGNRGSMNITPITITINNENLSVWVRQYPISIEGRKGLQPIVKDLLKDGILEPCLFPHNIPILPITKSDGNYRLVQDLREVNKRVQTRYPVVANPYTLLSGVPPQHCWYSVVDLKDAFWACPLAEECRNISAFSWEDPDMGQKQQLQWTRLPQGYTESPTLFGHAVEELLQSFPTPSVIQVIQ